LVEHKGQAKTIQSAPKDLASSNNHLVSSKATSSLLHTSSNSRISPTLRQNLIQKLAVHLIPINLTVSFNAKKTFFCSHFFLVPH
jgi:hypothetical protein